jgi:hypothetical protein
MSAVLLDRRGRPEPPPLLLGPDGIPVVFTQSMEQGWAIRGISSPSVLESQINRLPQHIIDHLEKSKRLPSAFQPRASMQSWRECLVATIANDTAVTTPASETVLSPGFTFPAGYFYPGRVVKLTMWGMSSTVITTPGTLIFKLRAGVGGTTGTLLVTSGTYAPDPSAASTQLTTYLEFYTVCRAAGTAAATLTAGRMWMSDLDDASATALKGNLDMHTIPPSAPATVNIDTTATNTWSPTLTPSVTTGSYTNLLTILEALT